jgi:hypothetical protein
MSIRPVKRLIKSKPTLEGAGVPPAPRLLNQKSPPPDWPSAPARPLGVVRFNPPSPIRTRLPGAQVPEGSPQVGQRPSPSGPIARSGPYRFRAGAPLPSAAGLEAQDFLSGVRSEYRQQQERGHVPRSFALSESCAR